jgi:hypothetical protein
MYHSSSELSSESSSAESASLSTSPSSDDISSESSSSSDDSDSTCESTRGCLREPTALGRRTTTYSLLVVERGVCVPGPRVAAAGCGSSSLTVSAIAKMEGPL